MPNETPPTSFVCLDTLSHTYYQIVVLGCDRIDLVNPPKNKKFLPSVLFVQSESRRSDFFVPNSFIDSEGHHTNLDGRLIRSYFHLRRVHTLKPK
mmetsp:Transcript_20718/g.34137  ORF Transcript_20718/g.34137 Transcript_20718/m.34137 type:complete len:95 (+) Transcript_20718:160-444(+)